MKIYPIKTGEYDFPLSYVMDTADQTVITLPILAYYIEGAEKKILFDVGGIDPKGDTFALHTPTYRRSEEERLDLALKREAGVDVSEIDIVVLSHLHWDHCRQMDLFPQAEFWVRMDEVIDSINPVERYQNTYESFNSGHIPPWARQPRKWHFLNTREDVSVVPGIDLILLPGHSVGLQGMTVRTEHGFFILPSDIVMRYEQIQEDGTVVGSHLCYLPEENQKSLNRLTELVQKEHATIIPSHDMRVLDQKVYPA